MLKQQQQRFNLNNKKVGKVLDFGCGTGDFANFLSQNNWNAYGVEPNKNGRGKALNKGVNCFESLEELKESNFDIITLWHVLEHLPDYNSKIQELKSRLNTEGYLIIAVPNFESFDALYYKQFWAAWDVPRHLWHFSEKAIREIGIINNLEVVNVKPMWFDAFYVSLLSEKYKNKNTNFFTAFKVGLLSNLKAVKTKQFSSKIYILKQKN